MMSFVIVDVIMGSCRSIHAWFARDVVNSIPLKDVS